MELFLAIFCEVAAFFVYFFQLQEKSKWGFGAHSLITKLSEGSNKLDIITSDVFLPNNNYFIYVLSSI